MKKTTAAKKADVQDDDDPNGLKTANKPKGREAKSQLEGPAALCAARTRRRSRNPFDSRFSFFRLIRAAREGAVKPDDCHAEQHRSSLL